MKRAPKKRIYTDEYLDKLVIILLAWIKKPKNYWLGKFAEQQGFSRNRLAEFATRHDGFSAAYELAKQSQENKIVAMGMKATHPTFHIFTLKNVAGWRDKTEIDHGIQEETLEKYASYSIEAITEAVNQFTSGSAGRAKASGSKASG